MKKILILMTVLCLSLSTVVFAEPSNIDVPYFAKETVTIVENIVLMPFRLIRDIFDPPPSRPVMVVPYSQAPVVYGSAPAPIPVSQVSAPAAPPDQNKNTVEITIPNGNGSYMSVTLRKTDKGFLGPQGEFYPDRPTDQQLKERYAQK